MSEQIVPPPAVQAFGRKVVCPRCGSGRIPEGKVMLLVRQRAPGLWLLVGKCFACDLSGFWSLVQADGEAEQPDRERCGEDVPLPDGFKGLLS